jgi:ABC-2 type transport system ATP-binding protein
MSEMATIHDENVIIKVEHLVKRYPRVPQAAVDDVSLTIQRGETFGLLGPNGAGKTTTIGILTTTVLPTGGRASISGFDVVVDPIGVKQCIAVVPQRSNLDRSLRISEILTYHAAYHGVARVERTTRAEALLEELGLKGRGQQKLNWFSGGMEQRVMLGRALMHEPEVLFLDEPTNNLDPQSRLFLWDRIAALRRQGVTVVLTTHDMEEADRLCDRIAIMDHGRILALDTPEGLKRLIPGGTKLELRIRIPEMVSAGHSSEDGVAYDIWFDRFGARLEQLPGVAKVERLSRQDDSETNGSILAFRLYATESNTGTLLANVAQVVLQERGELHDLRVAQPGLEDVFIYLTGKDLRS